MSLINIAGSGRFAADRAVREYAERILGAEKAKGVFGMKKLLAVLLAALLLCGGMAVGTRAASSIELSPANKVNGEIARCGFPGKAGSEGAARGVVPNPLL